MKAEILESPNDVTKPAIKLVAESAEDQTVLWCLSVMGPTRYDLVANEDSGDAKVAALILEHYAAS